MLLKHAWEWATALGFELQQPAPLLSLSLSLSLSRLKHARWGCGCHAQKQPEHQMVKVLKALTLDRMGKRAEAMALADSVRVQNPSDEHTLSTLALVYKVTLRGAVACSWREGLHQRQLVFLSSAAPRESS